MSRRAAAWLGEERPRGGLQVGLRLPAGGAVRLSILVVSYNVRELLGRCLRSIEPGAEVVVVDNCSSDGSVELVGREFPAVRLIAWGENRGFSAAVNEAARVATGDLLLLLNPDAELPPGTQARMMERSAQHPEVAVFGFRQVDAEGRFQLAVGPPPWLWAELLRKLIQGRIDRGDGFVGRLLDRLLSRPREVPWVAGSCMLIRRTAFHEVGGFDDGFFLYFEDIDFCLRVGWQAGRVLYDPTVTVIHHRGRSAASASELAERAYRASQLRFWLRHRGPWVHGLVRGYLALTGRSRPG